MILPALEQQIAFALEQKLAELEQRLLRENHTRLLSDATLVLDFNEGETMSVRRHERDALRAQNELGTVQEVASVLPGDGELCSRHHLLQRRPGQSGSTVAAELRQRRKVLA